ncbi:hypothetical protein DOK67_0002571 [Enterococcus sp. DIV0212c]|uniref:hypothetical protein n=1 Tax=Enterococcus sp. DIV0212c TaxID=2230867 RepID=UPI001A9A9256|nr:hypothetical protein [Enterococcus sp. DIV0212c]MBO1353499.1 hypothetical protein [Enterococcus sp. DIV0212c]
MCYLSKNSINELGCQGAQYMNSKTLVIIYNAIGFTEKIDSEQEDSDFFSNKEIGEIFDALYLSKITILSYSNELAFVDDIINKKLDFDKIVVWNLSRQGFDTNKKSLATSLCDFLQISYIGSSVYTMNLCRHKYHFQKILSSFSLASIPTFLPHEITNNNELFMENQYITKYLNGSASRGMNPTDAIKSYEQIHKLVDIKTPIVIQEYQSGYEIEVPLFQINQKFQALGIAGIAINGERYFKSEFVPEELFETTYSFYNFSHFAKEFLNYNSLDFIVDTAIKIAEILELKDYCRIDFRINNFGELFCFDISTTPYLVEHSSFSFLIQDYGLNYSSLLPLMIGAFNSNIDNH